MTDATAAVSLAVIIVNFETPEFTIAAVESMLASRAVRPDIIVIDNASRDDSVQRLRARFQNDAAVTVVARAVNDGFSGGNNAGVRVAIGRGARYAFLLNSDATAEPDCLRTLIEEAERDSGVALVAPRIFFGDKPDQLWFGGGTFSLWRGRALHVGFRESAAHGWQTRRDAEFVSGCSMLVRLDALGGRAIFDETLFAYGEDLDLSLRLRASGHRLRYVPDATVWHFEGTSHRRAGGDSLRFYLSVRNALRVLARHARWYHWPALGPVFAVDTVARYGVLTLLHGDLRACGAIFRGAVHALTGGRHRIESRG